MIKEFFIPQGWEIGLKRKIQKGKTLWHYFPEQIQKLWIQDWNEKIRLLEAGDLIQSFDYELPYASGSKNFEARLALFGEEGMLVTVRETTPMVCASSNWRTQKTFTVLSSNPIPISFFA